LWIPRNARHLTEGSDEGGGIERENMSAILFLIPLSVLIAAGFLAAFIWAVKSGQFEDTCTPSMRLLTDDRNSPVQKHVPSKDNER
jgi:cbb3-type cytochrome oxidase maturation protein